MPGWPWLSRSWKVKMQKHVIAKIERHLRDVRQAIVREALDIPRFKMHAGDCPGAEAPDFDDAAWAGFSVGETWGGYDPVSYTHLTLPTISSV